MSSYNDVASGGLKWQYIAIISNFLVIYSLVGWLVSLGPEFLDNEFQPSLKGSPRNLHINLALGQG